MNKIQQKMRNEQREKMMAAIHEAAQAFVVISLGGFARPKIWQNKAIGEPEKSWMGTCELLTAPPISDWKPLVGLAGLVAECIASNTLDTIEIAAKIQDRIDSQAVSDSDLALMHGYTNEDIERVTEMLLFNWDEIAFDAKWL